jgi:Flp pilus assembly protein TadD
VHAYWLAWNGEVADADAAMQAALRLDPLSSYVQADAGWIAYWAGRLDAAAARCTRTVELEPGSESGRLCLLFVRIAQADQTAARRAARAMLASKGATSADLAAFDRDAAAGLAAYWSWEIRRLEAVSRRSAHDAFLLALAYAQTGRRDEAFRELEIARAGRTPWMLWLEVEPRLAALRNDPRWPELVRRMGRPQPTAN